MEQTVTHIKFRDACTYLHVGNITLHDWVEDETIKPDVYAGRQSIFFTQETLDKFMESRFYKRYKTPKATRVSAIAKKATRRQIWFSRDFPDGCRKCHRSNVKHIAKGLCATCYTKYPEMRKDVPTHGNQDIRAKKKQTNNLLAQFGTGNPPDDNQDITVYMDMGRVIANLIREDLKADIKETVKQVIDELLDAATKPQVPEIPETVTRSPLTPVHGQHPVTV